MQVYDLCLISLTFFETKKSDKAHNNEAIHNVSKPFSCLNIAVTFKWGEGGYVQLSQNGKRMNENRNQRIECQIPSSNILGKTHHFLIYKTGILLASHSYYGLKYIVRYHKKNTNERTLFWKIQTNNLINTRFYSFAD